MNISISASRLEDPFDFLGILDSRNLLLLVV